MCMAQLCRYFISECKGSDKYNDPLMAGGVMNGRAVTFSHNTTKVISLSLSEVFCRFAPTAYFFVFFLSVLGNVAMKSRAMMGCFCSK